MATDIMTIDEVADYLRINKKTAYRLAVSPVSDYETDRVNC